MTQMANPRGGARPGAGRKPGPDPNAEHRTRRMIMLNDNEVNQARALGQGNISAGVRLAIELSTENIMLISSVPVACPHCGKPALCSPSKGVWCPHCQSGKH